MEETTNSIKDAIKERFSNPFLGKFLLAWIIWNWKISYMTLFVSEDKLSTNKMEFVSDYLRADNFLDFINIYIIPLFITALLIWVIPFLSNIAFNVSEDYRKKRALKTKEIDDEISNKKQEQLNNIRSQLNSLKQENNRLNLFAKYLTEERVYIPSGTKLVSNENLKLFQDYLKNVNDRERVLRIIDRYNAADAKTNFINQLNINDKDFLFSFLIIHPTSDDTNNYKITDFGIFVSKYKLYRNYKNRFDNLNKIADISL
ncbi:hypothetical protein EVU94_09275 [Flavobacteriaceae bacterium 144Ye]|nr:hypothetical protein EVU94_09275 [Flavobacteriaceae bacterium 144Ye]